MSHLPGDVLSKREYDTGYAFRFETDNPKEFAEKLWDECKKHYNLKNVHCVYDEHSVRLLVKIHHTTTEVVQQAHTIFKTWQERGWRFHDNQESLERDLMEVFTRLQIEPDGPPTEMGYSVPA